MHQIIALTLAGALLAVMPAAAQTTAKSMYTRTQLSRRRRAESTGVDAQRRPRAQGRRADRRGIRERW